MNIGNFCVSRLLFLRFAGGIQQKEECETGISRFSQKKKPGRLKPLIFYQPRIRDDKFLTQLYSVRFSVPRIPVFSVFRLPVLSRIWGSFCHKLIQPYFFLRREYRTRTVVAAHRRRLDDGAHQQIQNMVGIPPYFGLVDNHHRRRWAGTTVQVQYLPRRSLTLFTLFTVLTPSLTS